MRRAVLLVPAAALLLAACGGKATSTDQQSYTIDQTISALTVDARAAAVTVEAGTGPVTVTEEYRYSGDRPATAHRVDGTTLTLTESGCGDDDARCETRFRIRMPAATTLKVGAQAGAVRLTGAAGDVEVTTEAGAVEGTGLAGDHVTVRTQAGATELEFAEPPAAVVAETELGAVEVRVPRTVAYAVSVAVEAGKSSVSVDRDAASPHRIDVRTKAGAVTIEPLP